MGGRNSLWKMDAEFLFYKKKQYFSAPSTSSGIYYVRYSTDRRYKKVKFCDADSVLQAFGEYVGYRAGCYRENSTMMLGVLENRIGFAGYSGKFRIITQKTRRSVLESCFQIT